MLQHCPGDQEATDKMAGPCSTDDPTPGPKSGLKMDTIRKEKDRKTKDHVAKNSVTELEEMGLTWDEAQATAQDCVKWRQAIVALCPRWDEED